MPLITVHTLDFLKDHSPDLGRSFQEYDWVLYQFMRIHERMQEYNLQHLNLYLAGGAIRDIVLGKQPKDYDFFLLGPDADEDNALLLANEACQWAGDESKYHKQGESAKFRVLNFSENLVEDDPDLPEYFSESQIILRPEEETIDTLLDDFDYDLVRGAINTEYFGNFILDERFIKCFEEKAVHFPTWDSWYRGCNKVPMDWKITKPDFEKQKAYADVDLKTLAELIRPQYYFKKNIIVGNNWDALIVDEMAEIDVPEPF